MIRRAAVALALLMGMAGGGLAQTPDTSAPWSMDGLLNPLLSGCQLPQDFVKYHDELKASTAVAPSGGGITYNYGAPFTGQVGDIKASKDGEKWVFTSDLNNATWKGLRLHSIEYQAQGDQPRVITVQFDAPGDAVKDTFFPLVSSSQQIIARSGKSGTTGIRDAWGSPVIYCMSVSGLPVTSQVAAPETPPQPSASPPPRADASGKCWSSDKFGNSYQVACPTGFVKSWGEETELAKLLKQTSQNTSPPSPAPEPQSQLTWKTHVGDAGAAMSYAVQNTDEVPFSMECSKNSKLLSIYVGTGIGHLAKIEGLYLTLSSGTVKKDFRGMSSFNEMNDRFEPNAVGSLNDLAPLFRNNGQLSAEINGDRSEFPLNGAASEFKEFEQACNTLWSGGKPVSSDDKAQEVASSKAIPASTLDAGTILNDVVQGCKYPGAVLGNPAFNPYIVRNLKDRGGRDSYQIAVLNNVVWRGLKVSAIIYEQSKADSNWRILVQFADPDARVRSVLGPDLEKARAENPDATTSVQADIVAFNGSGALICQSSPGPWINRIPNGNEVPSRSSLALKKFYVKRKDVTQISGPTWAFFKGTDGKGAGLSFGVPETDDIPLSFHCSSDKKTVAVTYAAGVKGVKAGGGVPLSLRSGSKSFNLTGLYSYNGMFSDYDIEADIGSISDLKIILTSASSLAVEVKGTTMSFPLGQVQRPLAEFVAACAIIAAPEAEKTTSGSYSPELNDLLYGRGNAPAAPAPAPQRVVEVPKEASVTPSGFGNLHVCNKSGKTMSLFTAHPKEPNSQEWVVQGWGTIKGLTCGDFVVPNGLVHYYARTDTKNWGGKDAYYCVTAKPFEKKVFKGEKCVSGEMRLGTNEIYVEGAYNLNLVP